MKDTDLGWCAGLFDGEGSIGICHRRAARTYHLGLRIQMTDERTVRHFRDLVGLGTVAWQAARGRRLQSWTWFSGRRSDVAAILSKLLPHLVTKEKEASLALRFLEAAKEEHPGIWAEMRSCKTRHRTAA